MAGARFYLLAAVVWALTAAAGGMVDHLAADAQAKARGGVMLVSGGVGGWRLR